MFIQPTSDPGLRRNAAIARAVSLLVAAAFALLPPTATIAQRTASPNRRQPATTNQPAATSTSTVHAGLLRYPCISAKNIAFVYANKLWIVPRAGGMAL